MAQARRKNSLIKSVLLPVDLIDRINATIQSQHHNSTKAPLSFSEFIRRAIERDLAHNERSKRKRSSKRSVNNTIYTEADMQPQAVADAA